jgi:hypothetical protein
MAAGVEWTVVIGQFAVQFATRFSELNIGKRNIKPSQKLPTQKTRHAISKDKDSPATSSKMSFLT